MSFTVTATGDSLFTAPFPKDYKRVRRELDAFLSGIDLKLTNLETNVVEYGGYANQYSGGCYLATSETIFDDLASFGFDFYGTANNHCMDFSYPGLISTIDFLESRGYAHAGTGRSLAEAERPAVVTLPGGERAAVFAVDAIWEPASMAGKPNQAFAPRPGVNFLRRETVYAVSEKDLNALKRIAAETGINYTRNIEVATGFDLPDPEGCFTFGKTVFTTKKQPATRCCEEDLRRLVENVRKAKEEYDYVFMLVHCHDDDGRSTYGPPAFLTEFCRAVIDAGTNAVFGGGCHEVRGIEIYSGCPIFYSLGDFVFQETCVKYLPPDYLEKYGAAPDATAEEGFFARSKGGRVGLQYDEIYYLSFLPKITFDKGKMTGLSIVPVKLGFGAGGEQFDGLPYIAKGKDADRIFELLRSRSAEFGTVLTRSPSGEESIQCLIK